MPWSTAHETVHSQLISFAHCESCIDYLKIQRFPRQFQQFSHVCYLLILKFKKRRKQKNKLHNSDAILLTV